MSVKAAILTEGKASTGFGHIIRCKALYEAFSEKGIIPKLFVNGEECVSHITAGLDCKIVDWIRERESIFSEIDGFDVVVIDSYLADEAFYEKASRLAKVAVYIDDFKRISYPEGIVVNGNIYAESLNYPKSQKTTYLLGTKFTPLRKEFWSVPSKKIKEEIESVMITFGGSDVRNLTPQVLKALSKYSGLTKYVIIGGAFKNLEEIKAVSDQKTELIFQPDAGKMLEIMMHSDVAVSAAGQTLYELARTGTPVIAVAVAENQVPNAMGWQKAGFAEYAGWWEDENLSLKIAKHLELLADKKVREQKSRKGRELVDGRGCSRIAKEVMKSLILSRSLLRAAEEKDMWAIYEISNDETVRQVSINPRRIEKKEHERWYRENYKKDFFVLEFDKKVIGQVRFPHQEGKNFVSISLHRDYRGFGVGEHLLREGVRRFFSENPHVKEIFAVINSENTGSIKIFERVGFKRVEEGQWLKYKLERKDV